MFNERMAKARSAKQQRLPDDADEPPERDELNESIVLPRVEVVSDDEYDEDEFCAEEFYK